MTRKTMFVVIVLAIGLIAIAALPQWTDAARGVMLPPAPAASSGGETPSLAPRQIHWLFLPLVLRSDVPPAPQLHPISNPGNDDYVVDWSNVNGAAAYTLQEDDNAAFSSPTTRYVGPNSHYEVASQPTGTWHYRVRATGAWGDGPWSNTQSVSVGSRMSAPTLYSISNADGDGNYLVGWSSVSGPVQYILQEDDNPNFSSPVVRYQGLDTSISITWQPEGTWYYRVQYRLLVSAEPDNNSPWSNTQSVTVGTRSVPAPYLYDISNPSHIENYVVAWTGVSGATSYTVQEANVANWYWYTRYVGPESYVAITWQPDGTWCYRVLASNAWGSSGWSNSQCTLVSSQLATPILYPISNPDNNNYIVDWSDVPNAISYTLQEDLDPNFSNPYSYDSSGNSYFAFVFHAPGTWYYRVRAYNSTATSAWSVIQGVIVR